MHQSTFEPSDLLFYLLCLSLTCRQVVNFNKLLVTICALLSIEAIYENFNMEKCSPLFLIKKECSPPSGEILLLHTFPLSEIKFEISRQLFITLSRIKFPLYVVVNFIQMLQSAHNHLLCLTSPSFQFYFN